MSRSYHWFLAKLCILGIFWMMSCTRSAQEERQQTTKETLERLLVEFNHIQSLQDFSPSFLRLQALFEKIAELFLNTEEELSSEDPPIGEINEKLKQELVRIYRLEGGREWMEKAQEKALGKIEIHHKRLQKKRLKHST